MHDKSLVSILISDLETHRSLPRLLQSIARQSNGLDRIEIVIVGNGSHDSSSESIWTAISGIDSTYLINTDEKVTPSQARNIAAEQAKGDYFLFLCPDYRLDPKYMTTAISVFGNYPKADVMYTDYIRLAPKHSGIRPGMIQLPSFDTTLLQSKNILGPAVMIRRSAFENSDGFRDNTIYRDWDLWIQLANGDNGFYHVNYPLASCEYRKSAFRERAEDGRYKAMIVINNPSYFHEHTLRWALAYLRGETWAQAFNFMIIPTPVDVARMMNEHTMQVMGTDSLAQEAIRQFDTAPDNVEATR